MSQWFCIRTSPQRELALCGRYSDKGEWVPGILERKGYEVFCPVESKSRRVARKGKRRTIYYPMFTGYLFVKWPFIWKDLMDERHVIGKVCFEDGRPAPISEREMKRLMAMSGGAVPHRQSINPHKALREGERAEIAWGACEGNIIEIENLHGRIAEFSMQLFGREVKTKISIDRLEAA